MRLPPLLPVLCALGSSCSEHDLVVDPQVRMPAPGTPSAQLDPSSIDFGVVGVLEAGTDGEVEQLVLSNTGTATLQLFDIWFVEESPALSLGRFDILTVAAGSELAIEVGFAPTEAGLVEDELRIYCDDPDREVLSVPVPGEGRAR